MTSVVSDQGRGSKERMAPQTTHTTQPQKQRQATAEQIRLAQIIDKSDADFEGKIKQLVEVTGRTQDECVVALHDCNEDVNRAINFLLEGATDKSSWETVGKKRSVGKEGPSADAKDTREKRGEREAGRGRGGPSRRGRGTSRTVDARLEENGFDAVPGDRGVERGRRGRGKGPMGRGRGPVGSRFPPQGMGTFNPADYANSATAEPGEDASGTNGSGPWQNHLEDWASEDWSEDLSETKVFTASFTNKSHVPYEHGAGLVPLLPKAVAVGGDVEPPALQTLGQSLVFTNSQQPLQAGGRAANSYAAAAAAGTSSAFISTPKPVQSDLPRPESLAGPRPPLAPTRPAVAVGDASPAGEPAGPTPEAQPVTVPTNEAKAESPEPSPELVLKSDPEPSAILGQLLLQQQQPPLPAQSDLQGLTSEPPLPPRDTPSPAKPVACEPPTPDAAQQRQTRPQRRRAPPPSKIPSSAVEMPGAADVSGLNVQFGALDFGTEAGLTDQEPGPAPTGPTPHLSKPITASESLGGLPPCLPPAAADPTYPLPSLGLPAASAPPGPRTDPPPPRGPSAPDAAPAPLSNGFGDVRTTGPQDGILKLEATVLPSESVASCPSSTNTPTPSLSSHVSSSHVVGTVGTASPSLTVSVSSPSVSNGLPSAAPSTIRSAPPPSSSSGKPPPNLPQGVPPLLPNQYIMGPGGLLPAYPQIYGYEELQMIQSRLPMDYYGMTFPATTLAGRDGGLASNPYSGEATKFGRADSSSPAPPPTSLSAVPPPSQTQPPAGAGPPPPSAGAAAGSPSGPGQGPAFLGAALPAGYGYTGVPYYASLPAVPAVPSAFQYGPAVFVPPGSGKQHALGLANPSSQYQPPAGYGQHAYGAGFDDVNGDYGKGGYGGGAQSQTKPAGSSTVKAPGLSGSVGSGGVPDLNASVYSKSQSFDKQGFPAATPQAFSLPSALGGTGAPYGHAPFLHILPAHQQPHSQLLHHHLAQDTQAMPGQRSQSSSMQKSQVSKSSYGSAPYWPN